MEPFSNNQKSFSAGCVSGDFLLQELRKIHPECPDLPESTLRRERDREWVRSGVIAENELLKIYSKTCAIPLLEEDDPPMPDLFPGGNPDFFNANACLPFEWDEEKILFLISDPYFTDQLTFLSRKNFHRKAEFKLVRCSLLERLLSKVRHAGEEEENTLPDAEDENTLRTMAGEARIVRLVNDIFTQAIELGASDIHIEPGEENVSVRCRIDGVLSEIVSCPLKEFPAIASRIKLLGGLNIAESRLPQDGRTNVRLGKMELDMRISTIPILTGESIVLRLLNAESVTFDLKTLGMSQTHLSQFERLIRIPHGIILVVGPTGSGKTTTLYSVINQLNDRRKKIITIEDPVEYKTEGLCQVQVNPKIGVTFAEGLRSIVRQDPDIILVGEIRDRETADIAINAALTGHLVLSTLHTNDAVGAVTRLLDMGVENFLVSSALFGVLSQRLVRKICPVCHGNGKVEDQKCKKCNGTGYKGRCGIFELLILNEELRAAVNKNASSSVLQEIAVRHGMVTLKEDGESKVTSGITTEEELRRSTAEL